MKSLYKPILALCIILISFVGCVTSDIPSRLGLSDLDLSSLVRPPGESPDTTQLYDPLPEETPDVDREFRAVWVATVQNLDFPTKPGLSAAAMKREIDAIVANCADMGLSAVILQVRPNGDALYESEIFPWSACLTGEQGKGVDGFDPLAYWIEACRGAGIELHAWLNPYRIIHTNQNSSDPETLAENNPVRRNPALAVAWATSGGNKGLFLDPGLPEARQLIIDGVRELIRKYDIDGVHIDDYFYPGQDFDDSASFAEYGAGLELDDWRRENVNELIRGIQAEIYAYNEASGDNVRWGISPTAIWKNGSSDPLGISTTNGQESYHAMYADTRRWVTEQWVDYICPQIYWYIGYDIADFAAVFAWWEELCSDSGVDFYVGHAAYREFEDNQPPNWQGEIVRQLEFVAGSDTAKGSAFFRYFSMRSGVGQSVREFYAASGDFPVREPVIELDRLSVGFPAGDSTLTGTPSQFPGYNIVGESIADLPLFVNGEQVQGRTAEGFFHYFAPLQSGDNVFTFSQEGQEDVTRVITLKSSAGGGGEASATPTPDTSIVDVTALDYVTVTSDEAWVFSTNATSNGLNYMLTPGQRDRIVAKSGDNLLKLSCGAWIRADAVEVLRESAAIVDVLKSGTYRSEENRDIIAWKSSVFPAVVASFDDGKLTVEFGMHNSVPPLEMPRDIEVETLFESYRSGVRNQVPYYEFTLSDDARFEGFYIDFENDEFRLILKKRKSLSVSELPLTNITVMLDAGHGGGFPGAIGPMGHDMPEKQLTLNYAHMIAERLEEHGASVFLTRESDVDVSLQERVNISRRIMPDLFISLHIDSVAETTNARNIRGFTVWYNNENGKNFARTALDVMQYVNPGTTRQGTVNWANNFVCRPWWSPHLIFEASYIMNIDDFVWLIDPAQQERYADAAVDAILDYFG